MNICTNDARHPPGQAVLLDAGAFQEGCVQKVAAQQLNHSRVQEPPTQLHLAAEQRLCRVGAGRRPGVQPAQEWLTQSVSYKCNGKLCNRVAQQCQLA